MEHGLKHLLNYLLALLINFLKYCFLKQSNVLQVDSNVVTDKEIFDYLEKYPAIKIRHFFNANESDNFQKYVEKLRFSDCDKYLGSFSNIHFSIIYNEGNKPTNIKALPTSSNVQHTQKYGAILQTNYKQNLEMFVTYLQKIFSTFPSIEINDGWIHKYSVGAQCHLHQDPLYFQGCVLIAVFGNFEGGEFIIENEEIKTEPGDLIILRAKYKKLKRPLHCIATVKNGCRISLVLNCIK